LKTFTILCGLCVLFFVSEIRSLWAPSSSPTCTSEQSSTPVVIHTNGGLLEVSRIQTTEIIEATTRETLLGIPIGNTVARLRVPAVYRYHVELAPEWTVHLKNKTFVVISPPVKSSVPVAIDTGRLQAEASGTWSVFTGIARIDELRASITKTLNDKAESPAYVQLQRETARQTLKEFVKKWLVTQERWKAESEYPIRVYFADEPIQTLNPPIQSFIGSL